VNNAAPVASGLLTGFIAGAAVFIVVASVPALLINQFWYMFSLPLGLILGIVVGVLVGGRVGGRVNEGFKIASEADSHVNQSE